MGTLRLILFAWIDSMPHVDDEAYGRVGKTQSFCILWVKFPYGSTSLATVCKTLTGLCWEKILIPSMSMCELKYITTKQQQYYKTKKF